MLSADNHYQAEFIQYAPSHSQETVNPAGPTFNNNSYNVSRLPDALKQSTSESL